METGPGEGMDESTAPASETDEADRATEAEGMTERAQEGAETSGEDAAGDDAGAGSLESELEELKDRHLRLAAEFENFRKRTRKEAAVGRTMAQAELVQQILPTLDDLARVADTPHETTTVQALDEGIELILRNLRKQLGDAGLERIEALDQPFNPERHQAIMTSMVTDPELDETVSRVFQEGYEFLGRLVRPAQVEVRRYEEPSDGDDIE
ncbi:MAG: nucleotide exchange factor GrpE [Gemmatimonadales bacterium]